MVAEHKVYSQAGVGAAVTARAEAFSPGFGWWMKPYKSQGVSESAWGLPLRLAERVFAAGGVVVVLDTCITMWSSYRRKSAG